MLSRRSLFGLAALAPLAPVAAKAAEPMWIGAKVARLKPYLFGEVAGESLIPVSGSRRSLGLGGMATVTDAEAAVPLPNGKRIPVEAQAERAADLAGATEWL